MSVETAYRLLFQGTLIVLSAMVIVALIRTVTGRLTVDKIIGINLISTIVVIAICVLAVLFQENYIVDIAMVYVMISFVAVMILCKIYINLFAAPGNRKQRKGRERHDD
ncbi:MAG: sodium:proton antiporter [Clostridiales bacterium]|jgi:multicomponent Na+:H+ antiporter subunit F|nr:sodium:proton antiporter [Clostridiales bacterium]